MEKKKKKEKKKATGNNKSDREYNNTHVVGVIVLVLYLPLSGHGRSVSFK